MNKTRLNKATKIILSLHIAFLVICAVFVGISLSALKDSKGVTGSVTFAMTNSPVMTMNLNFQVGQEHYTYLGTTAGAQITNDTDVLRLNVLDDATLSIKVIFSNNTIVYDNTILFTQNGVALNMVSNTNDTIEFQANTEVLSGDYVVLDKILSAIYPSIQVQSQSYEIVATVQASGSAPATARMTGNYSMALYNYSVNFTINDNFGELSNSSITIPYGATYLASGNSITFMYDGEILETITAEPLPRDDKYTYEFVSWSSNSGTVTADTVITANFSQAINKYTVTFYNYNGDFLSTSTVEYGSDATFSGTTPTRPDDDYTYTFSGWVTTQGGTTKDDLTNVIANRNVYASFTATMVGQEYELTVRSGINAVINYYDTKEPINSGDYVQAGRPIEMCVYNTGGTFSPTINNVYGSIDFTMLEEYECGGDFHILFTMPEAPVIIWYDGLACCVYEDTLITLADGTTKRADEIQTGDKILSYNFDTGEIEIDTVTRFVKVEREELINIKFADGTNVKVTIDHPLFAELGWECYDKERGELSYGKDFGIVGELQEGDKLFSISKLFDKEIVSIEYIEGDIYNVYQFGTENNHNYFANSVLSSAFSN